MPNSTRSIAVSGFWDQTHPKSARCESLASELIPGSGKCDTLEGEWLRAATKIHYDLFNNGWGCNNWSGAVVFLKNHIDFLPKLDKVLLNKVTPYSTGMRIHGTKEFYTEYYTVVTSIIEGVLDSISDTRTPNTEDMWDYSLPEHNDHSISEYDEY